MFVKIPACHIADGVKKKTGAEVEAGQLHTATFETKGEAENAKKKFKKMYPGSKVAVIVDKQKAKQATADHKEFLKREKEKEKILKRSNKVDMIPVIDGQDPLAF